jgi:hypothetical protein
MNGSYGTHEDLRGHTGGGVTLGQGFPIVTSTKQKINTRSSTESELVGVDDCMPAICWTRYFLEAQGYHVAENILFQDNQSAILLEKNDHYELVLCTCLCPRHHHVLEETPGHYQSIQLEQRAQVHLVHLEG